jgi:O-acetylhomoserine/O-acetylserine sulfhydrylase-like pyridoxal-dependent enzyme
MRTHPALRQHLDWHERMTKYFSNPTLAVISKQIKRESEQTARAVGSLKLNLKEHLGNREDALCKGARRTQRQ